LHRLPPTLRSSSTIQIISSGAELGSEGPLFAPHPAKPKLPRI
jgi:hypothetical protein